ncbi:MAG TPA: hypothetical protein VMC81_01120 [Rhodocyclaceae bacterium]|nr:hypothetical protein [Rhodocyclaceae bacterium]
MHRDAAATAPPGRLAGFLALSALLHLAWLALPIRFREATDIQVVPAPLIAHLSTPLPASSVPDAEPARPRIAPERRPAASQTAAMPTGTETDQSTPAPRTTIDLDAAHATARAYAREPVPHTSLDAPKVPLTVEAAIAKATAPEVVVESHGPAGEHVVKIGKTRCVTPTWVPLFMEGVKMLTQCGS